ncbi:MAG: 2-oxo acid dehydrogenase subunit E2 [Verrucomicrobia bacterium]|nr:2-oxo acid dehydrogenase subunit E2 [Verrucomicrobiota bacterium]
MDFRLPTLGEGADSGTVVNILVNEGDTITKGQTVIELETGKAVTPIPSAVAGQITKLLVKEGQKLSVGAPILSVSGDAAGSDEAPAAAAPKRAGGKPAAKKVSKPEPEEEETEEAESEEDFEYSGDQPPPASPSLRRLAQDLGINLRKVRGSEGGGRIVLTDLKAYIANLQALAKKAQAPAAAAPGAQAKPVAAPVDFSRFGSIYKRPMTPLRKVISQRMAENWNAIPHVTQFDNIDLTNLMAMRKKYVEAYEKKGAKLTVTALSLKAVVNALKKHPIFNSSLDEVAEEIVFKEYFHIGIAVDTDQGLIVPVIRNADKKSIFELAKELAELAEKTRDRKVSMEDLQGGTFTISNQGSFGGAHFTPIVNRPEVAILGMGKGAMQPVVTKDGKIEAHSVLPVGLSYDHRVIDGGSAARFMVDLVNEFQNFNEADVKI